MKEDGLISTESGKFGVKEINLENAWRNTQRSCTELKFTIPAKNTKHVIILKTGREKKNR